MSPYLAAWIAFALYAMLAAATIQLVILPYVLPNLHAGHGLINGGDSISYHQIAVRMATEIDRAGWKAWSLDPEGHTPAGLAAPFYALIAPEPWSLIPANAMLHATAGVIVMYLLRILGATAGIAFVGAAFWVGFPSSMQWVSQIQKDGYFFAGMLSALLGWILLWRANSPDNPPRATITAILLIGAGVLLAGMARTYGFELLRAGGLICACVAIPSLLCDWRARKTSGLRVAVSASVFLFIPLALAHLPHDNRTAADLTLTTGTSDLQRDLANISLIGHWNRTPMLPVSVDRALMRISIARGAYNAETYANAGSHIDPDVQLHDALEFAAYLPRAMQIGFLGPFPSHWFAAGTSPGGSLMRIAAGIEMTIVYALLMAGLPLALWRWRSRVELWMCVLFCASLVTVFAYATPNLGTLYRLRYGFEMTLAAIGFAGLALTVRDARTRHRHIQ